MNEWLRAHKKGFLLAVAIAVVAGLGLYGATGVTSGRTNAVKGPWGSITYMDGTTNGLTESQVLQGRRYLNSFQRSISRSRGAEVSSGELFNHLLYSQSAGMLGIEVGDKELQHSVQQLVRDVTQKPKLTEEIYGAFLTRFQIPKEAFEARLSESLQIEKLMFTIKIQAKSTDLALYQQYCYEKQNVRFLFTEINSKDFENKVDPPTADEIQQRYDSLTTPLGPNDIQEAHPEREVVNTKLMLSANVIYLPTKQFMETSVTEAELKDYYEKNKFLFPRAGKPGEFIPYEECKEAVRQKFWLQGIDVKAYPYLEAILKQIEEEQKKATPEHPFDLAAFAKEKKLVFWRTKLMSDEDAEKGELKPEAPNFKVGSLFSRARKQPMPELEKLMASERKKFTPPLHFNAGMDNDGIYAMQIADLQESHQKSFDEAKPALIQVLVQEAAVNKAGEAAKDLRNKWRKGEEIPPVAQLKDETFDSKSTHALGQAYFESPRGIGQVFDPAKSEFDPDAKEDKKSPRRVWYVGFPVERTLPEWSKFVADKEWSETTRPKSIPYQEYYFMGRHSILQASKIEMPREITDPPLNFRDQ